MRFTSFTFVSFNVMGSWSLFLCSLFLCIHVFVTGSGNFLGIFGSCLLNAVTCRSPPESQLALLDPGGGGSVPSAR